MMVKCITAEVLCYNLPCTIQRRRHSEEINFGLNFHATRADSSMFVYYICKGADAYYMTFYRSLFYGLYDKVIRES
jgi:hypothetical protein